MNQTHPTKNSYDLIEKILSNSFRYFKKGQLKNALFLLPLMASYLLSFPFSYRNIYEGLGLHQDVLGFAEWWFSINILVRIILSTCIIYSIISIVIGKILSKNVEDLEYLIALSGIKNVSGNGPYITDVIHITEKIIRYKLKTRGISLQKFISHKDDLEAILKAHIPEITQGKIPGIVEFVTSTAVIPDKYSFKSIVNEIINPCEFVVGKTIMGLHKANLTDLPHLLISGSTNSGKSVFTKQVLAGLIKSDPTLKLYLIDLKNGLELSAFATYYKSQFVEIISDAATVLKDLEDEMYKRLKKLKKHGDVKFNPKIHGGEYIVLCIDEASILFTKREKDDPDYSDVLSARTRIDNLSKLSRATGIHIIAATQKVTVTSIPSQTQENFTGKVSFHANTIEASMRSVGGSKAKHLPTIPGRGIWSFGKDVFEFQSPYISNDEINKYFPPIKNAVNKKDLDSTENPEVSIKEMATNDSKEILNND